jgi:hypothetical protein
MAAAVCFVHERASVSALAQHGVLLRREQAVTPDALRAAPRRTAISATARRRRCPLQCLFRPDLTPLGKIGETRRGRSRAKC